MLEAQGIVSIYGQKLCVGVSYTTCEMEYELTHKWCDKTHIIALESQWPSGFVEPLWIFDQHRIKINHSLIMCVGCIEWRMSREVFLKTDWLIILASWSWVSVTISIRSHICWDWFIVLRQMLPVVPSSFATPRCSISSWPSSGEKTILYVQGQETITSYSRFGNICAQQEQMD